MVNTNGVSRRRFLGALAAVPVVGVAVSPVTVVANSLPEAFTFDAVVMIETGVDFLATASLLRQAAAD